MEKFLSVHVVQLQFIDSMQFSGGASLDSLVKTLNENDFWYLKDAFPDMEQFKLVKSKGIFPRDFFDSPEKLKYKEFPGREKFFNTLADKECSAKDYLYGKQVWNTILEKKNLKLTMIAISKRMCYYFLISLKMLEKPETCP